MNLRQASTLAIVPIAFAAIGPTYSEGYSDLLRQRGNESAPTVVLRTSDLRSAYLIRSGQVRYDASDTTPAGLRRQLQRHFDTVVAFLLLNTPDSIEVALDRLQTEQRASWSTADREAWRDRLIASRRALIIRLVDYRNRGQFPRNEGRAAAPVPIFVDNHNIACAVGHLMRISHRERDVAGIQRENNLVYVPDVTAGPLVAWTLTSGITLEEAALIQPAYGPVLLPKPDDAIEVLNSDATFEFENLRYSKFQIFAGDDPTSPSVNIPVTHQACSWFGCGITFPIIWDADLSRDLTLVPDFELLVRDVTSSELQPNPPLLSSFPRVVVQFDVEVTAPNLRITQLPGGGSLLSNSYFDGRQFRLFVNDSRDRLWIDQRHNPAPTCAATFCQEFGFGLPQVIQFEHGNRPRTHGDEFRPTDRMTVVTELYFPPDQAYRGQFINFALVAVPEPATTMLIALAIGTCAISRWRTQID